MLKSWLGGKKAEKTEVINGNENDVRVTFNGQSRDINVNVYNIYTKDKVINSAMEKAFVAIDNDDRIEGLTIKDDKPIVTIERENFAALMSANEYLEGELQEEIKPSVKLFIKNPDYLPKNPKNVKWDFLYEGISKIKATISDEKYLSDVSNTVYRLGACYSLIVDLKDV